MTSNKALKKGTYSLWVKGAVLFDVPTGSWSAATVTRYTQDFKKCVRGLIDKPWAHILLLENWGLAEPAAQEPIANLTDWAYANNNRCAALVYPPDPLKRYVIDKFLVVKHSDFDLQHFVDPTEAVAWLNGKGYAVNPRDVEDPELD